MRKGVLVLVLALALSLAVAGCQGGKSATSSSSTPFIGGSEGLRVSFVDNAPPSEILDNKQTPFDITLRVENVGETDVAVNNVKTTIGGLYPADFGQSSLQYVLPRPVQGVKKDPEGGKITGGIDEITFPGLSYTKTLEGNNVFPIQADTCYTYQTRAVGDYCMRQDLTKVTAGVCSVKGSKPIFNSGGPVQVVSLSESVGGKNTIILSFTIKTVGSGSFFRPAAQTCTKGDLQSESFVRVTVDPGITGDLRCSGWGGQKTKDVRLVNGEASVTCILGGINVDALQKINIKLDYNNLISTSTSLLVKHLPGDTTGVSAAPSPPGTQLASGSAAALSNSQCNNAGVTRQCTTQSICEGRQTCSGTVYGDCTLYGTCVGSTGDRERYCSTTAGGTWISSSQLCDCRSGYAWDPVATVGSGTGGKCVLTTTTGTASPSPPPVQSSPSFMTKDACELGSNGRWLKSTSTSGTTSDCQCNQGLSPHTSGCATD